VLELFAPVTPHRRKRHSNSNYPPKVEGGSSFNGSVLSSNAGLDEFKRLNEAGEREWLAVVREQSHHVGQMSTLPNIQKPHISEPEDFVFSPTSRF
jgi:hypothetical protein